MITNEMREGRIGRKTDGRTAARNALLLNVLVLPGMGTLMAGKIATGLGQLAAAAAGFVLVMLWFVGLMIRYYGLMFGNEQPGFSPPAWLGATGAILFIIAWIWALATGVGLVRSAARDAERASFQTGL